MSYGKLCPLCKGTGIKDLKEAEGEKTCPKCDGDGYIEQSIKPKNSDKWE